MRDKLWRRSISLEGLLWLLIIFSFWSWRAWRTKPLLPESVVRRGAVARLPSPIVEASGLCPSRVSPGKYWTHNDSLDEARAFQVTLEGALLDIVKSEDVENIDWEACATVIDDPYDGQHLLYIADSGNNFQWRDRLTLYGFQEPTAGRPLSLISHYSFSFPSTTLGRPPLVYSTGEGRCRDLEAIFWRRGELFFISKCIISGPPTVWRLPRENTTLSDPYVLEKVAKLPIPPSDHPLLSRVTDSSFWSPRDLLAVLTYQHIWIYKANGSPRSPRFQALGRCPLSRGYRQVVQAEAISWVTPTRSSLQDRMQLAVLTERGDVYRYLYNLDTGECDK